MTLTEWIDEEEIKNRAVLKEAIELIMKAAAAPFKRNTLEGIVRPEHYQLFSKIRDEIIAKAIKKGERMVGPLPFDLSPNTREIINGYKDGDRVRLRQIWYDEEGKPIYEEVLPATAIIHPRRTTECGRVFDFRHNRGDRKYTAVTYEAMIQHSFVSGHSIFYIDDGRWGTDEPY